MTLRDAIVEMLESTDWEERSHAASHHFDTFSTPELADVMLSSARGLALQALVEAALAWRMNWSEPGVTHNALVRACDAYREATP